MTESPHVVTFKGERYFFEGHVVGCELQGKTVLIKIKEILYSGQTEFQLVEIFDTYEYGRMLVLDGVIQAAENDEFIYHECICHLPMFYHNNDPKDVLVIGGGDGGVLREMLKHPINHITMVSIDGEEIEVNKKHLSCVSDGAFEHEKATVIVGDGKEYIKKYKNSFDVIILDLTEPEGPSQELITEEFYSDVKGALKKGGVVALHTMSLIEQPQLAATLHKRLKNVFSSVRVHREMIPSFTDGMFSFAVVSDEDLDKITLSDVKEKYKALNLDLRYYTPKMHFASAVLPKYILKILNE